MVLAFLLDYFKIIVKVLMSLCAYCIIKLIIGWCSMKKNKINIYLLMVSIILCIGIMFFLLLATPILKLNGSSEMTVEVFSHYVEQGARAKTLLKDMTSEIIINGEVNTNQVGIYKITYQIKKFGISSSLVRFVHVVDTKNPILELKGEDKVSVCPKKEYEEDGYDAYDEYDGNLTEMVTIKKEENQILYSVKDKSNNETTKTRTIIKEDLTPPTLELQGKENITLYVGEEYQEPGYKVYDNCDEDLESKVIVEGSVDSSQIGTYELFYQVEDESGNQTFIKRTIVVKEKPIVIIPSSSTIYFTFDDGPSSITPKILDILKKHNVRATFFVINHSDSYNAYIKRAFDEGHAIAVHSYSHNYRQIYSSEENYINDFNLMREKIYRITGNYTNVFRFPGGSSNTVSRFNPNIMTRLSDKMENLGYVYFDWNVDSGDAGSARTSQDVYQNVVNHVGTFHSYVVLMHDFEGNYKTLNALEDIIVTLKNRGYQFDSLKENSYQAHHRINN